MASTAHVTSLQNQLYGTTKLSNENQSRTFQSSLVHAPGLDRIAMTSPNQYSRLLDRADVYQYKCPWGRARSYAGDTNVQLPDEHRPKWEPPALLQKTHQHFGSGADPFPRGVPIKQYYDLTRLKRSKLRWNDELMPRPTTVQVQQNSILVPFPKESPHTSHMSRQAMFPRPEPYCGYETRGNVLVPIPPPSRIINKAMGSYGRREVVLSRTLTGNGEPSARFGAEIRPVTIDNRFFSRHDVISEFNKLHPSNTPTIRLPIQRLRKADWQNGN